MSSELVRFPIGGMTCTSCVAHITKAVRKVPGVQYVKVYLATDSAVVGYETATTSLNAIATAIDDAGYEAFMVEARPEPPAPERLRRGFLARLGIG